MPTSPKSVRLDDDLWSRLDTLAAERSTTRNDLIAKAIGDLLDPPQQLAHTPNAKPKGVAPVPATLSTPTSSKFGPKVDTSMVSFAGDLPSRYSDRLATKRQ